MGQVHLRKAGVREQPEEESGGSAQRRVPVPAWDALEGAFILAVFLVLQGLYGGLFGGRDDSLLSQAQVGLAADATVLLAVVALLRCRSRGWRQSCGALGLRQGAPGWVRRCWRPAGAGAFAYLSVAFAVVSISQALGFDWRNVAPQTLTRLISDARPGPGLAAALALTVLVAPLTEEVIFRAALYLPLRDRLGVVPAALLVSVLFAAVHGYAWGAAQLTVLSVALVALFEATGTLWAAVTAHGLYNSLNLLVLLWPRPAG